MNPCRFMIVDDSSLTVKKITKMLEELGHSVAGSAKTGAEAVETYASINPDIVTMDITMPDMDGIEATEKIISENPNAVIIMVTSHGQEQMVMNAIKAGAKGYILKPLNNDTVAQTLEKVYNKYLSTAG